LDGTVVPTFLDASPWGLPREQPSEEIGMAVAHQDWANTFAHSGIANMAPPH
jgi:hypothetical protein